QANLKKATALLVMRFGLYRTQAEQLRAHSRESLRQPQGADEQIVAQQLGDGLSQQIEPEALLRRNPHPPRNAIGIALDLRLDAFHQVDLVVHLEQRYFLGANLAEYRQYLFDLLVTFGLVGIDDVQQQVGVARLFERRPKGLDQLVRQMANEAHGIGQDHRPEIVQFETPQGRVQGREQLVGGIDLRPGQRIEQRGLARVGVAHQGHQGHIRATSPAPRLLALAANLLQALLDLADANAQQATVGFQLGFTRATQADTAFLALQVGPAAHQTRAHVFQLSQFDLQLAFMGAGALREDIKNQTGSIEHAAFERTLEVALLAGCQGVVENDQLDLVVLDEIMQLFDLAAADQILGRRLMSSDVDEAN